MDFPQKTQVCPILPAPGRENRKTAYVLALRGKNALIQVQDMGEDACGRCPRNNKCVEPTFTQIFKACPQTLWLENACGAKVGDRVELVLPPDALFAHATLGYGLPLAGLFLGALAGKFLDAQGQGGAILGALSGFLLASGFLRIFARRLRKPTFFPSGNSGESPHILPDQLA